MRSLVGWLLICCAWKVGVTAAYQPASHADVFDLCGRSDKQRLAAPNDDRQGRLLDLRVTARHSMYDSSDISGQFIVTALRSATRGQSLHDLSTSDTASLDFSIQAKSTDGRDLQLASGRIALGTKDRLLKFTLRRLTPRLTPYEIRFILHGQSMYSATTELYYLPAKREGSSVKIDALHGGVLVANNSTGFAYERLIPFELSASCSEISSLSHAEVSAYKDAGVNTIGSACASRQPGLDALYDDMDSVNLWYQHSLESPLSEASMLEEVSRLKDRSSLLSWHVGAAAVQSSTMEASYALLRQHDPYHPVGLSFSCDTVEEIYSKADYITEAPRSSGQNSDANQDIRLDLSAVGHGGNFEDTIDRLDANSDYFRSFDDGSKPFWAAPQVTGPMTNAEPWVTVVLTVNRNAKGILLELGTTNRNLTKAYGRIAKAFNAPEVSQLLLSCAPTRVDVDNTSSLDVSYWRQGSQVLVAVANLNRTRTSDNVIIDLPFSARRVAKQPWGTLSWSLTNGSVLSTYGLDGLATSLLVFDT
ncbi:unnamed protein product [Zymoseptoria tritici ST99CH_3D7]|uniref:Alpha-galactosidase n=1 Tax=Zymoseptoria tritici (strain ST99CH_3D7) TaxID=1276538 RepID=A0A1X7RRI3_ZYMT9|nr:unnamed protein product [Zymoseptoria tritici ST99CH_3D7]